MSTKTLTESLKEVLGKQAEITEKKVDGDADEEKALKAAGKANKEKPKSKNPDPDPDDKDEKASQKKAKEANKEETEMDVDKVIDETTAADSLHPAARSIDDPKSKFEMITKAIGAMHSMKSDELTKWYTSAIENSKHYSNAIDGGKADANRNTLDMHASDASSSSAPKTRDSMPKIGVKEDVEEALAGFELTEETTSKLTTIFEAAVTARVIVENARLEEEFEAKLEETVEGISEDLADQIDNYLTYVVEHFMKENEVAIESTLRNELAGEFIAGIKGVFEAFVDVPESQVDVVETLSDKVTDLEAKFNEQLEVNASLKEALVEVERANIVEGFTDGLALSEADKFLKLAEGVSFDGDLEAYAKKLAVVKENYFSEKKAPSKSTNIVEESFEGDTKSTDVTIDPMIAKYMASIERNLKK